MIEKLDQEGFRIKGWHVLVGLIVFFGIITAVNAIMITYALQSFPGEEQKKSYMQGLNYNETLQQRQAQEALGWRVTMVTGNVLTTETTQLQFAIEDDDQKPVIGLQIEASLLRPASDRDDRSGIFSESKPGLYEVNIAELGAGWWILKAAAPLPNGQEFTFEQRLWLE